MEDINKLAALEIIDIISSFFKVPFELVVGKCRKRDLVKPRHISMYFVDMFIKDTLDNKGNIYGKGRDHVDILYARNSVNTQAGIYNDYRNDLDKLRYMILNKVFEDSYENYDTDKV